MLKWLQSFWPVRSGNEEMVEELSSKINRLEADYVDLARRVIEEAEARKAAERVREALLRRPRSPGSNIVDVEFRSH